MKIQHLVSFVLLLGYVQAAPRDEHIDDELESLYFEYGTPVGPEKGTRVLGGAETCTNGIETNNRSIPAEFIRLVRDVVCLENTMKTKPIHRHTTTLPLTINAMGLEALTAQSASGSNASVPRYSLLPLYATSNLKCPF